MVKYDTLINEDRNWRLIIMSSDKVMKAAAEMVSVLLVGLVWRPMVYCYMTDKFQENYEELFSALSGKCQVNQLLFLPNNK